MTTVCYRNGIMAADTALWHDDLYWGRVQKIERLSKGRLVGVAGEMASCQRLIELLRSTVAPDREALQHCGAGCSAIVADPDGDFYCIDTDTGGMYEVDHDFAAIGTGIHLAFGAMEMGATAEQAVRVACKYDSATREPLQVEALGKRKSKRTEPADVPQP